MIQVVAFLGWWKRDPFFRVKWPPTFGDEKVTDWITWGVWATWTSREGSGWIKGDRSEVGYNPKEYPIDKEVKEPINPITSWDILVGYVREYITQFYREYNKPWNKEPYKSASIKRMASEGLFLVAQTWSLGLGIEWLLSVMTYDLDLWLLSGDDLLLRILPWDSSPSKSKHHLNPFKGTLGHPNTSW